MDLPREEALRWIVSRYAGLRARHAEALGEPELLEPSGRHFPDPFAPDAPSVARLLQRMMGYAPVSDELDVRLRFVDPEEKSSSSCGSGGCGSGACEPGSTNAPKDRVLELEDGYLVELQVGDVAHPTLLTTALARSVGSLILFEAGEDVDPAEQGALSEVAAAATGFGVLLLSGAHVYGKSCGGVRMHQHTHLSVEEHGVLLALFARTHDIKPSLARAHLETTQREAYDEARAWVDSNPRLAGLLRRQPEALADGVFPIEPTRGLLGRLFASSSRDEELDGALSGPRPAPARKERSEDELRRLAEAKALVEDALREG